MTLLDTIPDPVEVGGGRQPQPRLRIDGAFVAPGQRGDQVLVFLPQPADPGVLLGPAGVRLGFFGQRDVVGHMPAPRSLAFAALVQAIQRVLAHRLQHPVTWAAIRCVAIDREQRLVVQRGQQRQRFVFVGGLRDVGRGPQRPAAGEHRHLTQHLLLAAAISCS